MDLLEQKETLRAAMRERLERYPAHTRAAESRSICRRLLEHLPKTPRTLCVFHPLRTEPDILPLIKKLLQRGDELFFPCFENGKLIFRRAVSLQELKPGPLQIPEPPQESPSLNSKKLSVALIPGRAFDRKGNRLGRGNGGYDTWIAELRNEHPKTKVWGVAFECQLIPAVPHDDPRDQPMDGIITARGLYQCRGVARKRKYSII